MVYIDSYGYTTKDTSKNAYEIIWKKRMHDSDVSVIGVSQWFHIARIKLSLKQVGFSQVYGYAPNYFEWRDIYAAIREIPAYIKYFMGN